MAPSNPQMWYPLEANPQLMNEYVRKLGFIGEADFCDVFSTEDWALDMIPQPASAVLVLYPLTDLQLSHDKKAVGTPCSEAPEVWFMKQRIGNACGTIGLLHTLLNLPEPLRQFKPDSWLASFEKDSAGLTDPIKIAERLEGDSSIGSLHDEATSSESNATSRGSLDDNVITHFVSLVCVAGKLWLLDGRKDGPVDCGPTSPSSLLKDSCKVVQQMMERDPTELRFTVLALAPKQQ